MNTSTKLSNKPVVLYTDLISCVVGESAVVIPLDHPSYLVCNGRIAYTSTVKKYDMDTGEFETRNTLYKPVVD